MTYYITALGRGLSALKGAFSLTPYQQLSETPFSDDRRELFSDYQRIQVQIVKAARKVESERNESRRTSRRSR